MTSTESTSSQNLIGVAEVAVILGVSKRTIYRLVSAGEFPAPIRIRASSRWRRSTVNAWIAERENA